jgi:hypothetical protein
LRWVLRQRIKRIFKVVLWGIESCAGLLTIEFYKAS